MLQSEKQKIVLCFLFFVSSSKLKSIVNESLVSRNQVIIVLNVFHNKWVFHMFCVCVSVMSFIVLPCPLASLHVLTLLFITIKCSWALQARFERAKRDKPILSCGLWNLPEQQSESNNRKQWMMSKTAGRIKEVGWHQYKRWCSRMTVSASRTAAQHNCKRG